MNNLFACISVIIMLFLLFSPRNLRKYILQHNMGEFNGDQSMNIQPYQDLKFIKDIPIEPLVNLNTNDSSYEDYDNDYDDDYDDEFSEKNMGEIMHISGVSSIMGFLQNTLNTYTKLCFRLFNVRYISKKTFNKNSVYTVVFFMISTVTNQSFLFRAIVYVPDNTNTCKLHSLYTVSPVPIKDKWSQKAQYKYEQTNINDTRHSAYEKEQTDINSKYTLDDVSKWDRNNSNYYEYTQHQSLMNDINT